MIKILKLLFLFSLTTMALAHSTGGDSADEYSIPDTGSSMFHLPIQIGFDGNINFGYKMDMSHDMSGMDHSDMDHDMGGMDQGDMNQGDMNNDMGEMDHGDMNSSDDSSSDSHSSAHSGIHWHLMPMINLGLDKINRKIKIDDSSFKLIRAQKIEAGAGLMVMGHLMDLPWSTMITAGLMPYKGEYKYMERSLDNGDEDNTFLRTPSTINELQEWRIGDKLSFSTHGGVMAHGGITFGHILDISANYMFQGKWRIAMEKVSDSKLKVTFTNEEMKHYSSSIGNMGLSINSGKMDMEGKSETFTFDMSSQTGVSAYVSALSGDLTTAQEIDGLNSPVYRDSFSKSTMVAFQKMRSLQIPVLFMRNSSTSKMYSLSDSTDNFFGMQTETNMAMTVDSKTTSGILSKHKSRNEFFMAMAMKVNQNNKKHVNYASSWKRLFERDTVKKYQFEKELAYLSTKTGFDLAEVKVPSQENYGYFRSEFEVNFTQGATDKLMNLPEKITRLDLIQKSYDIINDSFKENKNKMKKLCKINIVKSCHKSFIKSSSTLIVEMWDSLKTMKSARDSKDWKKFSTAYNKFGSFMMDNQFVFKAILSNLSKADYRVSLKTIGEKQIESVLAL